MLLHLSTGTFSPGSQVLRAQAGIGFNQVEQRQIPNVHGCSWVSLALIGKDRFDRRLMRAASVWMRGHQLLPHLRRHLITLMAWSLLNAVGQRSVDRESPFAYGVCTAVIVQA